VAGIAQGDQLAAVRQGDSDRRMRRTSPSPRKQVGASSCHHSPSPHATHSSMVTSLRPRSKSFEASSTSMQRKPRSSLKPAPSSWPSPASPWVPHSPCAVIRLLSHPSQLTVASVDDGEVVLEHELPKGRVASVNNYLVEPLPEAAFRHSMHPLRAL
jgi:hypothetical protein